MIHDPTASQQRKINALITGLAGFSNGHLQAIARMLGKRTILVDESLRFPRDPTDHLRGQTTPSVPGYENVIRLNPDLFEHVGLYLTDAYSKDTIPFSLLQTLPHENMHLLIAEMENTNGNTNGVRPSVIEF